ncbi:MAG: hypothetical protein ACXW4T_03850 [Candidatus Limnocylindrales bacterium]
MAGTTHGAQTESRETIVFGIILVAVGVGAFALNVFPDAGAVILLAIGLVLLATYAILRQYGTLIPGGILTGLGAGIAASQATGLTDPQTGGVIVVGLGLGFLSIWVIGALTRLHENHPWPLVPGGILTTIGVLLLIGGAAVDLIQYWPLALVGLGVVVLWQGTERQRHSPR